MSFGNRHWFVVPPLRVPVSRKLQFQLPESLSVCLGYISLLGASVMVVSFGGPGIVSGDQRAPALLKPPLNMRSEASVYLEVCLLRQYPFWEYSPRTRYTPSVTALILHVDVVGFESPQICSSSSQSLYTPFSVVYHAWMFRYPRSSVVI